MVLQAVVDQELGAPERRRGAAVELPLDRRRRTLAVSPGAGVGDEAGAPARAVASVQDRQGVEVRRAAAEAVEGVPDRCRAPRRHLPVQHRVDQPVDLVPFQVERPVGRALQVLHRDDAQIGPQAAPESRDPGLPPVELLRCALVRAVESDQIARRGPRRR